MEFITTYPATTTMVAMMLIGSLKYAGSGHALDSIANICIATLNGAIFGAMTDSHEGFRKAIPSMAFIVYLNQYSKKEKTPKSPPINPYISIIVATMTVSNIMSFILLQII
jgi:hypothetical protein